MNKKKLMTACAVFFSAYAQTVMAQFTISGSIKSEKGEAISYAVVGIKNTYLSTQTTSEGRFSFKNLKEGTYILTTHCIGYKQKADTITLKSDSQFDILLSTNDISLDEVMVQSTRADKESGMAYTTVSKTDIDYQNLGQDVPYILNTQPSVVINSDAGNGVGYTGIRIRGTDASRINTTINGIPVNDAESQGTFWVNMPDLLSSTNSIQVQRGVGTSSNGSGAFGGTINLQTNILNEKPYAEVGNSIGSFKTLKHTLSAGTGLLNNHFTFDARASKINSDGYIDRASSRLTSFYLSSGFYSPKTIVKAIAFSGWEKTYQAWYYVPEDSIKAGNRTYNSAGFYTDVNGKNTYYDNETDNYKQDNYQLHFIQTINNQLNFSIAGHYTAGKGYYEQYKEDQSFSSYKLPDVHTPNDTITSTDLVRRRWLDNDFIGMVYSLNYNSNKKLKLTVGGGYNTYFGKHNGEVIWARHASSGEIKHRYYDNNATKKDFNTYVKTTFKPIDKLSVFLDLQSRMVNYSFFGFDNNLKEVQQTVNYTFFNPKAGLVFNLSDQSTLYASFAIANKEPNRDDFTQSSPTSRPKAEELHDLELGVKHTFKQAAIELNFYNMTYNNQLVLNGQVNDVGAYNRMNVKDSYRRGIEISGSANVTKFVSVSSNLTLSDNKIEQFKEYINSSDASYSVYTQYIKSYTKTDISFSPNIINANTLTLKPVKNLEVALVGKYVGRQFLDNTSNTSRSINPYFVCDARINYTITTPYIKEIKLAVGIYNLLNTTYETNGYTYSYYVDDKLYTQNFLAPAATINFLTSLTLKF